MAVHKPVGGVESVALYPADAVEQALFSKGGCEVAFRSASEVVEVALVDDGSLYEEVVESARGVVKVTHRLSLVSRRCDAEAWLSLSFLERASQEGLIALVRLCDGRQMVVGYSQHFAEEQPLMLERVELSSGKELLTTPTVTLHLVSHDTSLAAERLF